MVDADDAIHYDGDRREVPMATAAHVQQPQKTVQIPNKLYFRIGDVTKLTGVKAYVLRFWEAEFPSLNPKKSGTNQRLYRRKDVETVLEIKHLLYEKRYTIEGARNYLHQRRGSKAPPPPQPVAQQAALFDMPVTDSAKFKAIRTELTDILTLLK